MRNRQGLTIGQVADRTGLATSAIRYYEDMGLVFPFRNDAGQRRFASADIRRLSFVMISQQLGFTIADIRKTMEKLPKERAPTKSDWTRISNGIGRLADAPMWIDDNPNLTIMEIRAKARRLKSQAGGLGLIVVDYLQLMSGRAGAENRQVEVSEISRGLKILARELECPVIGLSQLSRTLEMRQDKRPMLADLRESGAIEQDADVVMFLYRDEVYNEDSPDQGVAEIIIGKQRNGPIGTCRLSFRGQFTRFENLARSDYENYGG